MEQFKEDGRGSQKEALKFVRFVKQSEQENPIIEYKDVQMTKAYWGGKISSFHFNLI